ncbi:uncharacterized protein LOC110275026 [Arachis duranensis]|uniref:Uncharacterized protein LOC110275026 n=1 Tax=Arachis duranensis TaxID=130453 RepID=A0A9C6T6A3_ARADU|nr:uncharacterized protein LOC110275026 [Arachis duranensis]
MTHLSQYITSIIAKLKSPQLNGSPDLKLLTQLIASIQKRNHRTCLTTQIRENLQPMEGTNVNLVAILCLGDLINQWCLIYPLDMVMDASSLGEHIECAKVITFTFSA